MEIHDFKAMRQSSSADKSGPSKLAMATDRHLHRNWVLIPALIFAVLAAVAVFGDGQADRPAQRTRVPSLEQVLSGRG